MPKHDKERILFDDLAASLSLSKGDNARATLTGYVIKWDELSSDRGGYVVRLAPGSVTWATPTFALYNHDYDNVLARNDDGSLRIFSDDTGVKVEFDVPDTQLGRDLEVLIGKQTIRGMSFAMIPGGDCSTATENGVEVLTYTSFVADEVTITAIPAFDSTSIEVKAAAPADTQLIRLADSSKETAEQFVKLSKYKLDTYTFELAEINETAKRSATGNN